MSKSKKKKRNSAPRLEAKSLIFVIALLIVLIVAGRSLADPTLPPSGSKVPGRYIVMLKNTTADTPEVIARQHGVTPDQAYRHAFKGFAGNMTAAQVSALRNNPKVQAIEEDTYINVDPDPERNFFSALAKKSGSSGGSAKVLAPKGGPKDQPGKEAPPVASFTASPVSGTAPLTVTFTDTSTKTPTSWAWDFDNNGVTDSTLKSPTHTYSAEGTYSVKLTATNAFGSGETLKTNYITAGGVIPEPTPEPGTCDPVVNGTQQLDWGVNKIDAELNPAACNGGSGIGVAVLDTGADLDHPDLAGAIVASVDFSGKGTAEDGHSHGTHVAGTIGARWNSIGTVGVAPKVNLIPVKVMSDTGSGYVSWMVSGINWAIQNKSTYNIRVINMSIGSSGTTSSLETAVNSAVAAGIVLVAGAGNSFVDVANFQPAKYANAVAVSAMTSSGSFASYSNWGSGIDFIAPGSSIRSTGLNGGYVTKSGTSMAAPHVSGAFALWFGSHPTGTVAEARAALTAVGKPGPWSGDPDGIAEPMVYAKDL